MAQNWRGWLAARRLKDGDGAPLRPYRWWQGLLGRSVLSIVDDDGAELTVEVWTNGDKETGEVIAWLYRDGRRSRTSKVPAAFPVAGGVIEVAASQFGLKRCHLVRPDGSEERLLPHPRSAEGRRAQLERSRPGLSRAIGAVSIALLVIGLGVNGLQLAEPISEIPPIADTLGTFTSPIHLPLWLNIALGAGAAAASWERAMRLRFSWLLDGGGN